MECYQMSYLVPVLSDAVILKLNCCINSNILHCTSSGTPNVVSFWVRVFRELIIYTRSFLLQNNLHRFVLEHVIHIQNSFKMSIFGLHKNAEIFEPEIFSVVQMVSLCAYNIKVCLFLCLTPVIIENKKKINDIQKNGVFGSVLTKFEHLYLLSIIKLGSLT